MTSRTTPTPTRRLRLCRIALAIGAAMPAAALAQESASPLVPDAITLDQVRAWSPWRRIRNNALALASPLL